MRTVAVTGATGLLGGHVVRELRRQSFEVLAFGGPSRADGAGALDLDDTHALASIADRADAVIHCAALSAMADCARDPERARRINTEGTRNVARACAASSKRGTRLVHVSTDLVFDGESAPYRESDAPTPISVYGQTKLEAENAALTAGVEAAAIVVRVSLLFGPTLTDRKGFFDSQIQTFQGAAGSSSATTDTLTLFDDEWRTPLSLRAAAEGLVALATKSTLTGVIHLGGPDRLSRLEMGERLRRHVVGATHVNIRAASRLSISGEPRPRDVSLDSTAFHRAFPAIATLGFDEEVRAMLSRSPSNEGRRR